MKRIDRRFFLQGLGGATLALPFLSSLLPRSARAASYDAPKRFIAIKSYSTQNTIDWYPTATPAGYQLRDALYSGSKADGTTYLHQRLGASAYSWAPLTDFQASGISNILGTEFNGLLSKLLLLRGCDFLPDTNHNDGGMLGNYAACESKVGSVFPHVPTIDQVLAYSGTFYPSTPLVRSLHLAPGGSNSCSFTNYGVAGGAVEQVVAHLDPLTAFNQVFAGAGADPGQPDPVSDRNVLIVDRVYEDYSRLKEHPRLGSEDRDLVERHMSFLAELQNRLLAPGVVCTPPPEPRSIPNDPPYDDLGNVPDIRDTFNLMVDVLVAAIMCDSTRIVTLDIRKALSDGRGSETGYFHGADTPGSWHGDAHSWGDPTADFTLQRLNQWIANDIFLNVLEKLDVVESGSDTFLDNSIVYWGNELGFNHLNYSVPAVLAGSAGGQLETGKYIDYIDWDGQSYFSQENGNVILGIPHNRLLVTIMQAMGLSPSDYEDGSPGYGVTETAGKDPSLFATNYDMSQIGEPLPLS